MDELITLHLFADDYDPVQSWQLVDWCRKHGANDWTISAITVQGLRTAARLARAASVKSFEESVEPFRLPTAQRRRLTAYSHVSERDALIFPTELWRFNTSSLEVLQRLLPDGLFNYQTDADDWFEDPVLYREGAFMLGVISHEQEGILRVTKSEQSMLEAEGFPFRFHGAYVGY